MSIIITKDPNSPPSTLTSVLHTDRYCGPKEATICSLMESGFNSQGGTLLLPRHSMAELHKFEPITRDVFERVAEDKTVIATETGDLYIYDGMDDTKGNSSYENGIPHMSGDVSGHSSRFVIMMRNKVNREF